jgi:hypothetical protein
LVTRSSLTPARLAVLVDLGRVERLRDPRDEVAVGARDRAGSPRYAHLARLYLQESGSLDTAAEVAEGAAKPEGSAAYGTLAPLIGAVVTRSSSVSARLGC